MRETILITGVLGFIASSLAESLLKKGYKVIGVDNYLTGKRENISNFENSSDFDFIECDVNNIQEVRPVFELYRPDFVYHYAAYVGVLRTLKNPLAVLDDIKGFDNVFCLSRDCGVRKVLFSSSSEVYGEPVELPQVEDTTPLNSKLPYAVVKNLGEVYLRTWKKEYNLDYTVFRFFNTYGPRQSEDFVISRFFKLAMKNEPIPVYGDGSQTRTFCYIDDNVRATIAALEHPMALNGIINIGATDEVSIYVLARTIINVTNSSSEIVYLPPLEEGDMTRRKPDNRKMMDLISGRPLISLEDGLRRTYLHMAGIYI